MCRDGCIYGIPCDAEAVLRIDPRTDQATALPAARFLHYKYTALLLQHILQSVSQSVNQSFRHSAVPFLLLTLCSVHHRSAMISQKSTQLSALHLNPDTEGVALQFLVDSRLQVSTIGLGSLEGKEKVEKWEGGVLGDDGIVYCMPQQSQLVLKIVPPAQL